jgi:hypothetical protein
MQETRLSVTDSALYTVEVFEQCIDNHPNVNELLRSKYLPLNQLLGTASAERTFSMLRRLKTSIDRSGLR